MWKWLLKLLEKWWPNEHMEPILPDSYLPPPAPTISPVVTPRPDKIKVWAESIKIQEGWVEGSRSFINNSPGNIKFSRYVQSLGATHADKDGFAVFADFNSGFKALCQFLTDAANNQLTPYHHVNLREFTKIYAQPPDEGYCNRVAAAIGVKPETRIETLI